MTNILSVLNNPKLRSAFYQVLLAATVIWLGYELAMNARANLRAQTGLGFLNETAGFSVSQSLIPYSESDTYGRVLVVGLLNTLLVSALGILFATLIGVTIGVARLSSNWLVARLAGLYVEAIRNLPLLFQILFWYLAVLGMLPPPRQSLSILGEVFLSNRGLIVPRPMLTEHGSWVFVAAGVGLAISIGVYVWARRLQRRTGRRFPVGLVGIAIVAALTEVSIVAFGAPVTFEHAQLKGFNFVGGLRVIPEFVALLVALATYTAAFIAEIVRAGILTVSRGQMEAASALGLRRGAALRLIVIPQALRAIIPPLTSQYLNLTKNSSLAYAIGYPDLVSVFAGTTLNQTGQAIEIIAITMGIYLALSLLTSAFMNWYNARVALVER